MFGHSNSLQRFVLCGTCQQFQRHPKSGPEHRLDHPLGSGDVLHGMQRGNPEIPGAHKAAMGHMYWLPLSVWNHAPRGVHPVCGLWRPPHPGRSGADHGMLPRRNCLQYLGLLGRWRHGPEVSYLPLRILQSHGISLPETNGSVSIHLFCC